MNGNEIRNFYNRKLKKDLTVEQIQEAKKIAEDKIHLALEEFNDTVGKYAHINVYSIDANSRCPLVGKKDMVNLRLVI